VSLSKIEMVGFKSFMSPTSLRFREGITAILGPNGCGKTNIVDAVRWVLGEQSARQLRGSKMENVIFNGTQTHKPLGFASVNLTINNERGLFPLDYSEITITRKVYRSGVSEYFINKAPCRLKDIRDLFADTGTGSHSYSVIEQEMIDWVLNDVHGERRLMFEEAAGIVKYRMRREEAGRKLELTDADLVRLEDILEELRKQVRSLRYQMGKARRYQVVRERIRLWELIYLRRQLSELLAGKRSAESELSLCVDQSRTEDQSLGELERGVEEARLVLIDLEKRKTDLQNQRYEIRRRIQSSEEKIIQSNERQGEDRRRVERARREIEAAERRLATIAERAAAVKQHSAATATEIGARENVLGELGRDFRQLVERMQVLTTKLLEIKQTELDFIQDQVRVESAVGHFEKLLGDLDRRAAQTREEITGIEREAGRLAAEREGIAAACSELEDAVRDREGERGRLVDAAREVEEKLFEGEKCLAEKKAELAHLRSKRELLLRMKESFEGFPRGARTLLASGDGRIRGPLAEFVDVDERYRPACEAALAGLLDGVVVESFPSALALVRELEERAPERVRLLPEDTMRTGDAAAAPAVNGCLGALSSFVRGNDAHRSLVERLLGNVFLFENAASAISFAASPEGADHDAVTLSGVLVSGTRGIYIGGRSSDEVSLLGRGGEIEKLTVALADRERETGSLAGVCDAARASRAELKAKTSDVEGEREAARARLEERREALRSIERDFLTKREKISLLLKSLDEIEASRVELLSKLEEMRLSLKMRTESSGTESGGEIETEVATLQKRRDELEALLTERKIDLASLKGALEKDAEEARGLAAMEAQFREIVGRAHAEIASSEEEARELERTVGAERAVVTELLESERGFEGRIAGLEEELGGKHEDVAAAEKELKARKTERERIFERLNEIKVALSSIDTKMRDLIDKAKEMYNEDLSCYLAGTELPLTDEEAAVTKEMLDREKRVLEAIGPVNLAAVEEFNEKKSRLDFLEGQKADLVTAKGELTEAIATINKRARAQFLETFELVRRNFQETFHILFEGGEADLTLSEERDPLEADIIITARPKGKRLQDISLLSGGERALTALALLFALYKAKPSPFCIFDEVDAPLDDANVQRFIRMLKVFQKDTQFIIITHNKRTMEVAETLYGVTMEERGISRVVSVDFAGIEEVLKNRSAQVGPLIPAIPSEVSSN
jgi:chromosome segregation protein